MYIKTQTFVFPVNLPDKQLPECGIIAIKQKSQTHLSGLTVDDLGFGTCLFLCTAYPVRLRSSRRDSLPECLRQAGNPYHHREWIAIPLAIFYHERISDIFLFSWQFSNPDAVQQRLFSRVCALW